MLRAERLGFRVLIAAFLAGLLAVSSTTSVFAATEIYYDDGTVNNTVFTNFLGVLFSPRGGARILQVKFYGNGVSANVYITRSDHTTVLWGPVSVALGGGGWQTQSVPGVVVSGDFFVVLQLTASFIAFDQVDNTGRSYGAATMATMAPLGLGDLLIRVTIDSASVGGVVQPTDMLAILAPYLALIGLVVTIGVAVAVKRKHEA